MMFVARESLLGAVIMMTLSLGLWGCGAESSGPDETEGPAVMAPSQPETGSGAQAPIEPAGGDDPLGSEETTNETPPATEETESEEPTSELDQTSDARPDGEVSLLILPLTIVMLTSDVPQLNSTYNDVELTEMVEEVNEIWSQAQIRFEVRDILRSPAQGESDFQRLLDSGGRDPRVLRQIYDPVVLPDSGWSMVLLEHMGAMPPGVYFCDRQVLVSARHFGRNNRVIPPNVIAHELGHALGLEHACGQGENLMCADGQSPTLLWEEQREAARDQAMTGAPARCRGDGR